MLLPYDAWVPFVDWLNERAPGRDLRGWEELGLRPDAPPEAVETYEKYCAMIKNARRIGIRC